MWAEKAVPKPANVEPQLYECLLQLEGTSQPPVQNLSEVSETAKLMIALWAKYGDNDIPGRSGRLRHQYKVAPHNVSS